AFRTLSRIPEDKNRYPERRRFLLNASGIGQDEMRMRVKVMHLDYIQRVDEMNAIVTAQNFIRRLAYGRIEMHWVDDRDIFKLFRQPSYRTEYAAMRLTQSLAPVGCHKNKALPLDLVQYRMLKV